jgi:hypothetical protein
VRGVGDVLTLGYASQARAALWYHDEELAGVRNPYAYGTGYVAGFLATLYVSWAATPLRAAHATWATRAALLYTLATDAISFVLALRAVAAGRAGWFDYLDLIAPVSYLRGLASLRGRNTAPAAAIELAGNAAIRAVVQHLDEGRASVYFRPTARMLSDPRVVADIHYFAGDPATSAARVSQGRTKPVKEILGDEIPGEELIVSEAQRALIQDRLGVAPPRSIRTVGDVDGFWRALWHEIHDPPSHVHAGHKLDLAYNDIQARWEVRAFVLMIEFLEAGRVESARNLARNLFNFHHASANLASGSAIAGGIARRLQAGQLEEGAEVVLRNVDA